ncbi:Gfo/Idh/MocA family oxidoreductase [Paenibacillus sp. MMS20-IR301]|uniref:Gfo/Idh/MocA family protein n=1 Tax=Paenibacillus sp. MMS20-IR301 TaxID=2895946 RepID=UPI0028F10FE8|nr:Gfo/Idh/MocA family oxidoreductase [Paenibacillus sp. MMS20-IR301]WNS40759.1 Gfo/Idh/MocA family oxidoreductase [Paenibacillus sp. MMS20-IR301]
MLRAAVIGLGDVAPIHIAAIEANPDIVLAAVCDIDQAKATIVPGVPFYTDYMKMLETETLDCVHICLPHYLHYPVTKACAASGIHVFQEKPLALNAAEARSFIALEAENRQVKIGICLQNRFNETFERLQQIVAGGQYGAVKGVKGIVAWARPKDYYTVKPWRGLMEQAGGGVMINQAIHVLDQLQLLGGEIASIRGSVDQLLDYGTEVEDTVSAHIRFKGGVTGIFWATNAYAENSSVEIEVILEQARFRIKDNILWKINEDGPAEHWVEDSRLPGSKFYYGAGHIKLVRKFYQCIQADSQDYVHVQDAAVPMLMIDAIRTSSELKTEIYL